MDQLKSNSLKRLSAPLVEVSSVSASEGPRVNSAVLGATIKEGWGTFSSKVSSWFTLPSRSRRGQE